MSVETPGRKLGDLPAMVTSAKVDALHEGMGEIKGELVRMNTKLDFMGDHENRLRALELAQAKNDQKSDTGRWVRDAILAVCLTLLGVGAGAWLVP
jgi:hypothetical protein